MTEPLDVTQNPDGTWTLNSEIAEFVTVSAELWTQLEASEHVDVDRRPAGDQGQPAVTYIGITTLSHHLTYQVVQSSAEGHVLELRSYSDVAPTP